MSKYFTQSGIKDISGYDENQQIRFFIDNPGARIATSEDLRKMGYELPNSEKEAEVDAVNREIKRSKYKEFMDLKFGKLSPRSNTRYGGKGDDVVREDFETDIDWHDYQVFNGDIDPKKAPLNEQIQRRVRQNDLDMDAKSSHSFYNQTNNNDFVKKFYDEQDLSRIGVNIKDFQGWLNRTDHADSFKDMYNSGGFEDSASAYFGDQSKELTAAYQRQLSMYLDMYIEDVNVRANEKIFVEDYNSDPSLYKDFNDVDEAFEYWKLINEGGYSAFKYQDYNYYNNKYFAAKLDKDKENKQEQNEYLKERKNADEYTNTFSTIGELIEGVGIGFIEAADDMSTVIGDWLGFDGYATEKRMIKREENLADPEKSMAYMLAYGKSLDIDGTKYIVDRTDGSLVNVTAGVSVGETMDAKAKADIIEKINKEGKDDYSWNIQNGSGVFGHTIGNIIFQIAGTKGAGSLRSLGSLKLLAAGNKIKKLRGLKPISTRARNVKSGKYTSTKETLSFNVPFDPRIIDATAFQSFYGATIGHENTMTSALDAGIPYDEAKKLAQSAAAQMSLLYALTGPINPRLPGLNKLDDFVNSNKLIDKAIKGYKEGGIKGANNVISQQLKRLVPDLSTGKTFLNEGFKEFVQENVQQFGETEIVNRNINERAGQEFLQQEYGLKDFIQTSILSFAAGGLIGGVSTANFATPNSKKQQLVDMFLLSKDLKGTKQKFDKAVERGKITEEQSKELFNQIKAVGQDKIPAWMINTPDDAIKYSVVRQDLDNLKNKLKKDPDNSKIKYEIKSKEFELTQIKEIAAEQSINDDIKLFEETFDVETIALGSIDEIIEAGFAVEEFTEGWLESDGKIYINMLAAVENQAVSVASHELLHKIIKSEFKNNKNISKIVTEFKEILRKKGVLKKLEQRAAYYRFKGAKIDEGEPDEDEWLTMFSDALFKNEITFDELQENDWMRIGRNLLNIIKNKFSIKQPKYEFKNGQQVYDFILTYRKNIEKGKLSNKARRMLDSFTPDEKPDPNAKKKSISINFDDKIYQDKLNDLVDPNEDWIGSEAYIVAKTLIDNGSFDSLIGAKIASGTIYGKSRQEILEDTRDLLVDHLNNFDPTKNDNLFAYLNSYIAFKVGTITNKAKSQVKTSSIDVDREGGTLTQDLTDSGLNPEELMIAKEAAAAAQQASTKFKMGKKIPVKNKDLIVPLLVPIVRDLDNSLNQSKSINAKNSPIISEIKNSLGNSLIYDEMISVLGKRDVTRQQLLEFKQDILENATTTWLMGKDTKGKVLGGIPQAIDKVIKLEDGSEVRVSYPAWIGKEVAREKMGTDNAGRTSGHDLVFRSENISEISDDVYLSQFYDAKGKAIRGRKEAAAKQMAQEIGIEFLVDELANNKDGAVAQAFNDNQLAKGVIDAIDKLNIFMEQAERGGVKRSISFNKEVAYNLLSEAMKLNVKGNTLALKDFLNSFPPEYENVRNSFMQYADNESASLNGFIKPLKEYSKTKAGKEVKPQLDKFLEMSPEEKTEAIIPFAEELSRIIPAGFDKVFGKSGMALFGIQKRIIDPNSPAGLKIKKNRENAPEGEVPFSLAKIIQGGSGFVAKIINNVLNKQYNTQEEAQKAFDELYKEDVKALNRNNPKALIYILEQARSIIAANPKLIPGYLYWLQSNSNNGKALRGLTGLEEVQIYAENQAVFITPDGVQGYNAIPAEGPLKQRFDAGEVILNVKHPEYELAKKYVLDKDADMRKELENTTAKKKRASLKKAIDKSFVTKMRERLRVKGEHKKPASNQFGEVAIFELNLLNKLLEKPGSEILNLANRPGLRQVIKGFSQSIGTEILSRIQDDIHSATSSLGDQRVFAIPEDKIKSFYPMYGQQQALGRALRALKFDTDALADVMFQQNLVERSRSISDPKGISVYDFDDTLAFSSSKIVVTMPNGKVKEITPAQFAAQDEKLTAMGAKFNFEQFNKVVKGVAGPLAPRLKKAISKFGNDNIFVLTARPQASARAIYKFLKGIGLEIPIENITGLENGTPAAKAGWIINKVAQGYNDFYFVDDAYKNVQAVQNVLNVFDVKGKVQQAIVNRKRSISEDLNSMIERNTGVKAEAVFSDVVARKKGANKGKYKFFVPSGAEDFRGLTQYVLAGKGKQGEADQKFFEDNLVTPYVRGVGAMESARQALKNDYRALLKAFPDIKKNLNKQIGETGFTYDQAIRVWLYSNSGFEVPGISKRDQELLTKAVDSNEDLITFAETLQVITKKTEWIKPEEHWDVGSILKDLNGLDEKVNRKEFLAEFIENVDTMFDKKNLNKLEAVYGTRYREALVNIIKRMKSGSNKPGELSGLEGKWLNWVNNSVGTIMFFNRRSAMLQMLSFANFVNWSDNNPLMAAKAFANQPLYWKTWVKIFNSDKLKQRRGGLKSDVQEQEIANQAKNSKDKASAITSYLLKVGFTPTQIADSMAIATGGATFLINRTNTYLKQGMSQAEADAKAFEDFAKISDETQQSGDPMLISAQQSSHLGRLILAFQNTPMQYTRLMKKAGQDLINRRGDDKTNLSKIMYYGFIQNLIFNSLQQALFAMLPDFEDDDDLTEEQLEEKRQKMESQKTTRILNGMVDSILRGSGLAGAVISTMKNTIMKFYQQEQKGYMADHTYTLIELANISPPIGSKLRKVYSAIQSYKFNKDVMSERGFSLATEGRLNISPTYEVIGNLLSAGFNIPLDRAVVELQSISESLDSRNTSYQRIALMLGWRNWDVNAKNEENDFIKMVYKEIKKEKARQKSRSSGRNKGRRKTKRN